MSFVYNAARVEAAEGDFDWPGGPCTVLLVMTNTDIDDPTLVNLGDESSLDEMDAAGYTRQAVESRAITPAGAEVNYASDTVSFLALQNGTRDVQAAVLFRDSDSLLIAYIDDGFPITPAGRTVNLPSPKLRMI